MAFTQDEIQALNTIFEQKLAQHRLEVERSFEKRLQRLHLDFEQRLAQSHQEILHALTQRQTERQERLRETIMQGVEAVQPHIAQRLGHEIGMRQQHHQQQMETLIERTLAAHLLAVEQLLQQTNRTQDTGPLPPHQHENPSDFEAFEVQTELPWEDFVDVIGKILDERLAVLDDSLRAAIANMERYFSGRLHEIRDDILQEQIQGYGNNIGNMNANTNLQEVFTGLQQLEHMVESMQVAMTANHAMLSNRLYHHQHLPLERAHRTSLGQPSTEHDSTGQIFLQEHE